jgi:hypothetical protein
MPSALTDVLCAHSCVPLSVGRAVGLNQFVGDASAVADNVTVASCPLAHGTG